jgi:G3E family GTPase
MTAETLVPSRLLPVSILAGPAVRVILQDAVSRDANCRFGLLARSQADSHALHDQLMVEELAAASGGGYDPSRLRAQISAIAEKAVVDHLVIECDPQTHPIAFASLFLPDGGAGQRFSEVARLSSIVLAIDSETLINSVVKGNHASGVTSPCIIADQIECADVIVLNGAPAGHDFRLARAVVSALNPSGSVLEMSHEARAPKVLDAERSFDFEAAFAGAGWRRLMEEEPEARRGDEGVTTFVYRARQPFHPEKFWNLIQKPFPGVFRAKGFFWLASRMSVVGGLNIAGSECHYSPAGQWWAAHDRADASRHGEIPDRLKKEWAEPFGDRRQAIAFIGIEINSPELSAQLDACLLSDSEMKSGERSWAMLPDPFPAWASKSHDHDHECGEHDCCNH